MKNWDEVKDSGARQEFETGSVRDTQKGKGRFDLMPTLPLRRLAVHFENGARKYGDRNWEKGQPLGRYLDSAFRHLLKIMDNSMDEDHASAVLWNIMGYMHTKAAIEAGKLPDKLDDMGHCKETPVLKLVKELTGQIIKSLGMSALPLPIPPHGGYPDA